MIDCPHRLRTNDATHCEIASDLAGKPVSVSEYGCQVCMQNRLPQQVNRTTLGLALYEVGYKSEHAKIIKSKYADVLRNPDISEMQKRRAQRVSSAAKCGDMECIAVWDGKKWNKIKECFRDLQTDCDCSCIIGRDGAYVGEVLHLKCKNYMDPTVVDHVWQYENTSSSWPSNPTPISDWIIVTALSLLPHHQNVQHRCLRSWRRLGVKIVAGNSKSDINALALEYPYVEFVEVAQSSWAGRSTSRIYDLMQIGSDLPRLLINSDIEILGDATRITNAAKSGKALIGSRHNWTDNRWNSHRECWGIDAFLLHPHQVATFPDIDFAIGQTMWDYWIPYHLNLHNFEMEWVGEPFFYHEAHPIHWARESLSFTRRMLASHYAPKDAAAEWETDDFWVSWRRSLPFNDRMP